jgi:hypothetical protein
MQDFRSHVFTLVRTDDSIRSARAVATVVGALAAMLVDGTPPAHADRAGRSST